VMIGEMRDLETIQSAITVAETDTSFLRPFTRTRPRRPSTGYRRLPSAPAGTDKDPALFILEGILSQQLLPGSAAAGPWRWR